MPFDKFWASVSRRMQGTSANLPDEDQWQLVLSGKDPTMMGKFRKLIGLIPSSPRCKICNAPFHGPGKHLMNVMGRRPSTVNPLICNLCDTVLPDGGAETSLTMLFADVRGSTGIAERMSPVEFTKLLNRFYRIASDILVKKDAWVDKFVGDEVIAFFIPGFAGKAHARRAIDAAQDLLKATGHNHSGGPWIPIGIGIHTGTAYVGRVGGEGISDITALGDAVNVTARLVSHAKQGEVVISEDAFGHAALDLGELEQRELALKGRDAPMKVRVLKTE